MAASARLQELVQSVWEVAEPCPSVLRRLPPLTITAGSPQQATWPALGDSGMKQLVRCGLCYWLEVVPLEAPRQRRVSAVRLKYRCKE